MFGWGESCKENTISIIQAKEWPHKATERKLVLMNTMVNVSIWQRYIIRYQYSWALKPAIQIKIEKREFEMAKMQIYFKSYTNSHNEIDIGSPYLFS